MQLLNKDTEYIKEEQLTDIFYSGCSENQNIGVEVEKILLDFNTHKAVSYEKVVEILNKFDTNVWKKIYENNNLLGLKSDFAIISLEPGSQVEISIKPYHDIINIKQDLDYYLSELEKFANEQNIIVYNKGIQPVSTYNDIKIIPKERYKHMTQYLPAKNLEPFIMMRETAGVQASFDYYDEEDAIKKLSVALKLSPIVSSIYANSEFRNGHVSDYKSYRAYSWLKVDEKRCGYISKKLFENPLTFGFKDYVDIVLDIPMIFINRNNQTFPINKTFRTFLKDGFENFKATKEDWNTHLSLFFPDVRLKNYIEIRNHDAQNYELTLSVPALWKGIIYNQNAITEINNILSKLTYEDFLELREKTPKYALDYSIKNISLKEIAKEIINISYNSLKKYNEEIYVEPLFQKI